MISLQDALLHFNEGKAQWYGWKKLENGEVYSNLKLNDETATMPTEEEINAKIAELQVAENRKIAYNSIEDQLDMQYWDGVNGTTLWADHIAQVKADNPKPE
jgi:hypothetical protein